MFVIGLVLHVANYLFDLGYSFFFVASLYSLLISFFFALAIVKYRLVDIHFIIRGGILYSLLSGLVLVIYVLFIKNVCDILAKKFETTSLLLESTFVLVLVFLLRPLERKVEEFIDRFFYRERYLFRLKFFEFTRTLLNLLDLPTLLEATVNFISQALIVDQVGIWILESESDSYRLFSQRGVPWEKPFPQESPLIVYLRKSERAVELEYIKNIGSLQPEVREIIAAGSSLVIPLQGEEGLLGFILVGDKRNGKKFTIMEIEALEALAPAVAMAISRALLYQDLKKKDHQMMQSEKLAALGEMAASFVHGIRNPLGIILGSAETLRRRMPEPVQSEMIQFISEESERINHMLTSFLGFAKPKAPTFREVDLKDILERTMDLDLHPGSKPAGPDPKRIPGRKGPHVLGPGADPGGPGQPGDQRPGSHAPGGEAADRPDPEGKHGCDHPNQRYGSGYPPGAGVQDLRPLLHYQRTGHGFGTFHRSFGG